MDTLKATLPTKTTPPPPPPKVASSTGKKKPEQKFTEREKKTIQELKKIYLETIKLDVELQRDIYNLEKSYEERHNKIYEQRAKILGDVKKSPPGDLAGIANVSHFWVKVLKASYTEFINKRDEQVLAHLTDIRTKLYNEPTVRFVIEFFFEPNEFISNKILTKTYHLNCLPDMENPLTYDGAEIFKCDGCKIDWKQKEIPDNDKKGYSSFFEFFDPPKLPDNIDDPSYGHVNAILQNDFELGFYLKERVIPKAVLFFTGEIADCQSSDSDSDEDTDDNDNDDDEDDDDADPDVDGSSVNTPEE